MKSEMFDLIQKINTTLLIILKSVTFNHLCPDINKCVELKESKIDIM